jgi:hypothetical protein
MDSLLVTVARYSQVGLAVFTLLFIADVIGIMIYVSRSGTIDPEEGRVVTENRPLGGTGALGGRYWSKRKVLLSRSMFITEEALINGTATKAQRRLANAAKLAFVLFGLAWFCGGIAILPSDTVGGLIVGGFGTYWLIWNYRIGRKGRAYALRKLKERQESREARRHKP